MARVFPPNPNESALDAAQCALADVLASLPDEWLLLLQRRIGATPVDAVLIHPGIGVGLVDVGPRAPDAALAALRAWLELEEFDCSFPGELPTVAVGIARGDIETIGEALASAFDVVPLLTVEDPDWVLAVIELLLPSDLALAPAAGAAEPDSPGR